VPPFLKSRSLARRRYMPARRIARSSRETHSKPSFTVNPPQDGKCSKCRGLMDITDEINELDFHRLVWTCINCGKTEYQKIFSPRAVALQRPDSSLQDNETLRSLSDAIRHFREVAKAKEAELKGTLKTEERKRLRKQQLVLLAMVRVLQTIQGLYNPAFADAVMDAHPENPITPLYLTYELLMLRGEKHGLRSDEYIQAWFYSRKKTGDKAALSRARRGLQKDVLAPYREPSEMNLDLEIINMGPLPSRTIAKKLAERGFFHNGKPLSYVSVNERRKKLQKQLPWFRLFRPNC
jgi:chorismate mutase